MHTEKRHGVRTTATRLLAVLALLVATAPGAVAQTTYTWTKNSAATQTWTTTANWDANGQFVSGSSNGLTFFSDTTTALVNGNNIITGSVPTTLSMNTLTLNGRGAAATGATNITIGTNASTWTIGDGTTSTVNLNGVNGSQALNYTVAANLALNQANTVFTGDGTASFNFSGTISEASAGLGITKSGSSTLTLSGSNTYTGVTTINGGVLAVTTLANGGLNSGIGKSSNAATNLLLGNGATLRYTGGTASTDRRFTINGTAAGDGATLDASGSGVITFSNTATPAYGTIDQTRTLTLTGTNTGTNTLAALIADNGTGAVSLTKSGAGTWILTAKNTYTGTTTINAGTLQLAYDTGANNIAATLLGNGGLTIAPGASLNIYPVRQAGVSTPYSITSAITLGGGNGTVNLRFGSLNDTKYHMSGDVTGAAGATQTLAITQGASSTSAGDRTDILFSGVIANGSSGTLGLTVDFAGASGTTQSAGVSLSGLNTFSGPIVVTNTKGLAAGYLVIGGERSGNPFNLTPGSGYLGGGNYTNTISLATGTILDYASSANQTFGGAISGAGSLQKNGSGTLTLTTGNSYTGGTTLNRGTLTVGTGGTLGATTGALSVNNTNSTGAGTNVVLNLATAVDTTVGSLSGTIAAATSGTNTATINTQTGRTFTVNQTAPGTYAGVIAGPGTFTLGSLSTNTLTLSGTNTYAGGTVLNGGTLATTADANLGKSQATGGGGVTVNGTATWNLGGATSITYNRDLTINGGAILSFASGFAAKTISGIVSGDGALVWNVATDLILSNANNTFNGPITVTTGGTNPYGLSPSSLGDDAGAGGVNLGGAASTGYFYWYGGAKTFSNRQFALSGTSGGGVIDNRGSGALVIAKDLLITGVGAKTLTLGGTNTGANSFAGNISDGTGSVISLTKTGAGTWVLSGTNTHSGTTTVSAGVLVLGNSLALQNSALDTTNSVLGTSSVGLRTTVTALTLGGLTGNRNFASTGGVFSTTSGGYGSVTALTLNPGTGVTNTYTGVIADGAAGMTLTKTGLGTQILSANTYTGLTTITAGTLQYGANNAISTGDVNVNGGTLAMQTFSDSVGAVTLTSGSITGSSGALTSTVGFDVRSGSASAVLAGGVGLTKSTAGTVTLTGTNSYTGATQVNNGTLIVGVSGVGSTHASSAVTVGGSSASGTPTLGGTGTINGSVTVATAGTGVAGTIQGGDGTTGTLTIGNGLTVQSGATLVIGLTNNGTTGTIGGGQSTQGGTPNPTSNTYLNMTNGGTITIDPTANFIINATGLTFSTTSTYSYIIANNSQAAVSITNQDQFTFNNLGDPNDFVFSVTGNTGGFVYLNIAPVPEPAAVLGIAIAALGLGQLVRRRKAVRALKADTAVTSV